MIGVVEFNNPLALWGKKQAFRLNSDARFIKRIGLMVDSGALFELFDQSNVKKDYNLMAASLLINNGKDRLFTDFPLQKQLLHFVSDWSSLSNFNKKSGFFDSMLEVNQEITPNTLSYVVFKSSDEMVSYFTQLVRFSPMRVQMREAFLSSLNVSLIYEY